mgnify:CR=1 FL=1
MMSNTKKRRVLYIVLEGVLADTLAGSSIPKDLTDLRVRTEVIEDIIKEPVTDVVVFSNQTWIYRAPGIRGGEKFYARYRYVTECLREAYNTVSGQDPRIVGDWSIRFPWVHGLQYDGPTLLEWTWSGDPGLAEAESIGFMCRPIRFDTDFAGRYGLRTITVPQGCTNS